jgi:thiamine pyrophosphate-dependent acetolactate synthase large subunit-like protein
MNANELANLLEVDSWYKLVTREEIATMLRQQQAEIEALKAKTLTDDEIQEIAHGFGAIGWMGEETYEFARAILRKAQEK